MKIKHKRPDSPISYPTDPADLISILTDDPGCVPARSRGVLHDHHSFLHPHSRPAPRPVIPKIPIHQVHHELLPICLCPSWPSTQM